MYKRCGATTIHNVRRIKVMATKGTPKRDGSGGGSRANKGRGGCTTTQATGKGGGRR